MTQTEMPSSAMQAAAGQHRWPRWIEDIERLLPIRSQFILSGSIRDVVLTPLCIGAGPRTVHLVFLGFP